MRDKTAYNGFTDLEGHARVSQDVRMHKEWIEKTLAPIRADHPKKKFFLTEPRVESTNKSYGQQGEETQCPGTSENQTGSGNSAPKHTSTPEDPTAKKKI